MNSSSCRLFFAVMICAAAVALLLDDGALAIVCAAGALVTLPLAFGGDVDAIARATRRRLQDRPAGSWPDEPD